jgi:hypothetical protein
MEQIMDYIFGTNTEAQILSCLTGRSMISHKQFGNSTFGKRNSSIIDAMVLLHYTPNMVKFLEEFGRDVQPKFLNIEYLVNSCIRYSITDVESQKLLKRKLTDYYSKRNIWENVGNPNITFSKSEDAKKLLYCNVSSTDLKMILGKCTADKIINIDHLGEIVSIKENEIFLTHGNFSFDHAITTVKAPILHPLLHSSIRPGLEFEYLPTTLILYEKELVGEKPIRKPTFSKTIYILDDDLPYNRLNMFTDFGECKIKIVAEITGAPKHPIELLVSGYKFIEKMVIPMGKIKKINNLFITKTIEPVGRFAQWNPDITLDDVITRGKQQNILTELWQDQLLVHSARMDTNPYDASLEEKQAFTKEYILHMIDQSTDLLQEINWKKNIGTKPIYIDKIREQWIDVFKYWLSIGVVWGFTPSEFLKTEQLKQAKAIAKVTGRHNNE